MLSQKEYQALYAALTGLQQRVYTSTPIKTPWTAASIADELNRRCLTSTDSRTVADELEALKEIGLVAVNHTQRYHRIKVRKAYATRKNAKKPTPVTLEDVANQLYTDVLSLKARAVDLLDAIKKQADAHAAETQQFRELAELIKAIK